MAGGQQWGLRTASCSPEVALNPSEAPGVGLPLPGRTPAPSTPYSGVCAVLPVQNLPCFSRSMW